MVVPTYANWKDITAQINHIANRSADGVFSHIGDTGQAADKRYSDDAINEARRKAAYRVFEAIGSNPSHPYWSSLKTDVEVLHRGIIPPHYGEIGVPLIAPLPVYPSGIWSFLFNPAEGETISINGVTWTFRLSGAVVASAGTGAVNGTYTERGRYDDGGGNGEYPYYTLTGQPDPDPTPGGFFYSIFTDGNLWYITDSAGDYMYYGRQADLTGPVCDTPQECATWTVLGGDPNAPTVTARTFGATEFEVVTSLSTTAANFSSALNLSTNASISVATYSHDPDRRLQKVTGVYDTLGSGGLSFTMADSSAGAVTVSGSTFSGSGDYQTGLEADEDEIDSYLSDRLGTFSNLFGNAVHPTDEENSAGMISPMALRYSTASGILKHCGAAAIIPMIKVPDDTGDVGETDRTITISTTNGSHLITVTTGTIEDMDEGKSITTGSPTSIDGLVAEVLTPTTALVTDPAAATATGVTATIKFSRTAAEQMADENIPLSVSALVVRLALPMLIKEGDNMFRVATYLGEQGERELVQIKGGAVKVQPIDVNKAIQLAQRAT